MNQRLGSSFRDPSGHMIAAGDRLLRQINAIYRENYDLLMSSGLYEDLTKRGLLIPHREPDEPGLGSAEAYKVIEPERLRFISYPYEWSFSQLQDAALATLDIQRRALKRGMSLKDASAYNIQFVNSRPVLIDTLSFEKYEEGKPWVAYRQFCQHFLAPLALMAHRDVRLSLLLRDFIDGVPLDLASTLLPGRTRLNFGLLSHVHLHAAAQMRAARNDSAGGPQSGPLPQGEGGSGRISKAQLVALIDNLAATVRKLEWKAGQTAWAAYYEGDSYTDAGFEDKRARVAEFLGAAEVGSLVDLGANTGVFSRIASEQGIFTLSTDFDPGAVEINYRQAKEQHAAELLPMVIDLTNPSPAIGWRSAERDSFVDRCQVDGVLALALIHHLAIANNVPLPDVAAFFASLGEWLIVEFVPKIDPKVQTLLATREDIFPQYTQEGFEAAFSDIYEIVRPAPVADCERRLYLMRRK